MSGRGQRRQALPFTIQAEWFPKETALPRESFFSRGDETPLETEMRLFGSATRWAFARLLEQKTRAAIKVLGQGLLGLNSRYIDDAILKAQEVISSQKELIGLEIEETEARLRKTEKKIQRIEAKARRLEATGRLEEARREAGRLPGLKARRKKLQTKLEVYRKHRADGTIPKVVFGGRALWRKVTRGQASRAQWRAARRGRLYARGDRSKGGNLNLRIGCENGDFHLDVALSHLVPEGSTAPRLSGELWVPPKFRLTLWEYLLTGAPYAVELIRGQDGRYRAHITLEPEAPEVRSDCTHGIVGIDINPDGLGLASIDREGKPEALPEGFVLPYPKGLGKYPGEVQIEIRQSTIWLGVPELRYARAERREYLIGVVAQMTTSVALRLGKGLAMEGLDFKKDHDTNRAFNRMRSNFPWSQIVEAISRCTFTDGVEMRLVNPAYTSVIGSYKYQRLLGGTVHEAAAFTIARRAEGRRERFTPALRRQISALRSRLLAHAQTSAEDSASPTEGTGLIRAGILRRLAASLEEERLLRHNQDPPWRQRSRASPWGALVELRRCAWARPLLAGSGETPVG